MTTLFYLVFLILNQLNQQLENGCKNLIKDNAWFKNLEKPSCIDLIIRNRPKCSENFFDIRNWVIRFSKNDININESILQKTKHNHYHILQL